MSAAFIPWRAASVNARGKLTTSASTDRTFGVIVVIK